MNNIRRIAVSLIVLMHVSSNLLTAQISEEKSYVSIIVEGPISIQNAKNIGDFIRVQPGVITSRMDPNRKMYFGIFDNSSGLTIQDFKTWITNSGLTVKCGHQRIYGAEKVVLSNSIDYSTVSLTWMNSAHCSANPEKSSRRCKSMRPLCLMKAGSASA